MRAKSKAAEKPDEMPALTRQRRLVLDVVQRDEAHPTAAEVFDQARKAMPGISFATVYNSLRYLKEQGMVREIVSRRVDLDQFKRAERPKLTERAKTAARQALPSKPLEEALE